MKTITFERRPMLASSAEEDESCVFFWKKMTLDTGGHASEVT